MDEFRHRSFAQVCRAEANVSLSVPREGGRGGGARGLVRERKVGWFKVEDQLGRGVAGREESNASDMTLRCNPVATPSDRPLNRSGSLLLSARQRGVREL